jgi:YhcN/YlaJ family sporulation lipoprotein
MFILFLITLLVFLLLIGCRAPEKPDTEEDIDEQDYIAEDRDRNLDMDEDIIEDRDADRQIVYRAETIADSVVNIPGIDDATSIIKDDIAIVGVIVGDITENKLTAELKEQIINTVKRTDYEIKNVLLTEDPQLFERIDGIEQRMMRGETADKLATEINKIIKEISPTS